MMEVNNLGLQTELKPMTRDTFAVTMDKLATDVRDMREALLSVGMTTLGCATQAYHLTKLDSSMPDICVLDLVDWLDELATTTNVKDAKSRARQLDSIVDMVIRKVEPVATAPDNRHELSFLMRGLAHPRVQVAMEDLHTTLNKIANFKITTGSLEQKFAA